MPTPSPRRFRQHRPALLAVVAPVIAGHAIDAASGRPADPADAAASSWLPDEATLALWRSAGGAE